MAEARSLAAYPSRHYTLAMSVAVYVVVALLIAWGNSSALFQAEFWGEDGSDFFPQSLNDGWTTLFHPVYGYHFFLSRIIAYAATLGPVYYIPFVYAAASFVLAVITTGYFSRDGFSWLLPSYPWRVFVCVLLAIAPGSEEVFFNIVNLYNILPFLALLLLLEQPFVLSWKRFLVLVFLAFSSGNCVILLPLLLYFLLVSKDKKYLYLLGIIIVITIINVIGTHYASQHRPELENYANITRVPLILLENFIDYYLYSPLLGTHYTQYLMHSNGNIYWSVAAILIVSLINAIKKMALPRNTLIMIAFMIGITVLTFGMIAVARNYALPYIIRNGSYFWNIRYVYLPACVTIIAWFSLIYAWKTTYAQSVVKQGLAYALMALITWNIASQWQTIYPRHLKNWPQKAANIQLALKARDAHLFSGSIQISDIHMQPEANPQFALQTITIHSKNRDKPYNIRSTFHDNRN